ncbi:MAG TPA: hypothetical protein DCZ04_13275 [Syntrophorhabdus aromaticivorans]|nr:hypothetical protein [Syntrophorhabdus aromaticivorans]
MSPVGIRQASASRVPFAGAGGSDGFAGRVPMQWVAATRALLIVYSVRFLKARPSKIVPQKLSGKQKGRSG